MVIDLAEPSARVVHRSSRILSTATAEMRNRRARPYLYMLAVCMAAFWLLALASGGAISDLDAKVFSALRAEERTRLVELAWVVTWLGDWLVLVPLALVAAGMLLWRGLRIEALALLGTTFAVRILVALQKTWFDRARPDVEQWMIEYTQSFPSAHAANSCATFLAVAIILTRSRTAIALAIVLSAAVGTSRVILGVHWPTDVIGGWAFAVLATTPLWKFRRAS